jgi:hypothetical protein
MAEMATWRLGSSGRVVTVGIELKEDNADTDESVITPHVTEFLIIFINLLIKQ